MIRISFRAKIGTLNLQNVWMDFLKTKLKYDASCKQHAKIRPTFQKTMFQYIIQKKKSFFKQQQATEILGGQQQLPRVVACGTSYPHWWSYQSWLIIGSNVTDNSMALSLALKG